MIYLLFIYAQVDIVIVTVCYFFDLTQLKPANDIVIESFAGLIEK